MMPRLMANCADFKVTRSAKNVSAAICAGVSPGGAAIVCPTNGVRDVTAVSLLVNDVRQFLTICSNAAEEILSA